MSDPQRGAYTPNSDAPLSFDAREPVRGAGGGPPVTLMISAAILVVLVGAIFFVYRGGVRGVNDEPRPVGTPVGAMKEAAPADQAAKTDPASGLQIYKTDPAAVDATPAFAPPPETPQDRPLPRPAPTTPVTSQPIPPSAAKPAPVTVLKPTTPAPAPTPVAATPRPAAPATIAAAGGSVVQIGAFSNQAQADAGWTAAARVAPGMAAGKGKSVEAIDRDGRTLYRTAVTGFETRAAADAFCSALKAANKSCFVR